MSKEKIESMKTGRIKQIPYGITDYERIRTSNYYFVDKTRFIPALEKSGSYLFFIRPRRFGKSLFISIMEAYYDVYYKDRFDELFQGTFIHKNSTAEKNAYLVLKFDFSQVNPKPGKVEDSFLEYVRGQVEYFLEKYREYLGKKADVLLKRLYDIDSASDILSALSRLCRDSHAKTYILIDEYDNFANTILSSTGKNAYHDLTHGEGFYRAFFNVLKGGTSGMEAPFNRLFLTGVSPITMDDVTSGYNIGKNVSLSPSFNRMLGFTEEDITRMIEYYRSKGLIDAPAPFLLEVLNRWYGHYLFSERDDVRLYNSDMVLYFLDQYISERVFPKNLIDRNVRIDYGKLRHLIILEKEKNVTTNGNFMRLKDILEKGHIFAVLKEGFPLNRVADQDNFISLLFYFGLLTIRGSELDTHELAIPNETIRHLFYEYIKTAYDETGVFSFDASKYTNFIKNMALHGEWKPLLDFITGRMKESMSLRDVMTGEKTIQAFLNVYLGLSELYIIHSEKELNKGYADLFMEPFLGKYENIEYSYIIEIKYMNRAQTGRTPGAADRDVQKLIKEAENQLGRYSMDEKLTKHLRKTTLIKLILVFCGHEAVYIGEV